MIEEFIYDVFLSHSSKDKAVVRPLAERLRKDGLKVWFDERLLKAGDSIPAKIEEGLKHSRVLVLCMSANAFGADWVQLESQTFRFRDPLNKERRLVPLRLDDSPIEGSLNQFLYINWQPACRKREQEFQLLLEACRPSGNGPGNLSSLDLLKGHGLQKAFLVRDPNMYKARQDEVEQLISKELLNRNPAFRLVATSGESFLPPMEARPPRLWESGLGDAIERGKASFSVVLQAIDSDFAVARALANGVSARDAASRHLWRNLPLEDLVKLSQKKRLKIGVTDFPVNCSMFFTSSAVMLDPYLWSIVGRATENHFWVLQFKSASTSCRALEQHFDFLEYHSVPLHAVLPNWDALLRSFQQRLARAAARVKRIKP